MFVANLSSHPVTSVEEFGNLYKSVANDHLFRSFNLIPSPSSIANKQRSVGSTNLNRASSRSHAILTIEATMVDPVANTSMNMFCIMEVGLTPSAALTGKIKLVDLAGSENNKVLSLIHLVTSY